MISSNIALTFFFDCILPLCQNQFALTNEQDSKSLTLLFLTLRDITQYHSAPFTAGEVTVVKKLLQWPTEVILPVMDACRLLMMHSAANAILGEDSQVHNSLLQHVAAGKSLKPSYEIMMFKIVSNWVAKRQRTPSERSVVVDEFLSEVVMRLADFILADIMNVCVILLCFI